MFDPDGPDFYTLYRASRLSGIPCPGCEHDMYGHWMISDVEDGYGRPIDGRVVCMDVDVCDCWSTWSAEKR